MHIPVIDAKVLTLVDRTRSLNGSGLVTIDTYLDDEGAQYTSVGGNEPVMTSSAADMALKAKRSAMIRQAADAYHSGDYDLYDELIAIVHTMQIDEPRADRVQPITTQWLLP